MAPPHAATRNRAQKARNTSPQEVAHPFQGKNNASALKRRLVLSPEPFLKEKSVRGAAVR
jgi:hypothetical protein